MRKLGNILITGGHGFLGKELVRQLFDQGLADRITTPRSTNYDLRKQAAVSVLLYEYAPIHTIFHLAATVAGIGGIASRPATFFYDNMQMGMNMIHYAHLRGIEKLVIAGSVCAYPENASIPMKESDLWQGYPELSNGSYGIAKRTLVTMLQAYHDEYALNSAYALLTNLYGPYQSFEPTTSHVIPALIQKMAHNSDEITVWGNGLATRDFLYVSDAASALIELAQKTEHTPPLNIGSGEEVSIRTLVKTLSDVMDWKGIVHWDSTKPNGQKRRLLDLTNTFANMVWRPQFKLNEGLYRTIQWYRDNGGMVA